MRLLRRITLVMSVAPSSPANTAVCLEPRHFGMWSRFDNSLNQQNYEAYLRANSWMVGQHEALRLCRKTTFTLHPRHLGR
jgi:hypothetical protein